MRPAPQRDFLFFQDVARCQRAAQQRFDREPPAVAQAGQLVAQAAAGLCDRKQHGKQAAPVGIELRLGGKKLRKTRRHLGIHGTLRQVRIVEKLAKRCKRRIAVSQPQQQQLLKRGLAMPAAVRCTLEPVPGGLLARVHIGIGELLHKRKQQRFKCFRPHLFTVVRERVRHYRRVDVLPVPGQQGMGCLVDETHGIQRGRLYGRLPVALLIHAVRQGTAAGRVGKHGIAFE